MKKVTKKDLKQFWEKNKAKIQAAGYAATGVCLFAVAKVIASKLDENQGNDTTPVTLTQDANNRLVAISPSDELVDEYGAEYKYGCKVPFVTNENAKKFLDERGDTYQIDVLDDLTSVVWISHPNSL